MELLLFLSLLLTFILLLFKLRSYSRRPMLKMPPGPWQLPVIGSIHHLLGSLPHRALRDLSKAYGPIMHLKLGEVTTFVVSSPEIAREIMKTHDISFATRPMVSAAQFFSYGAKSLSFGPYGELWRQLRKICVLELLSVKRVQSFQSIREDEILNLVRSISSSQAPFVNLSKLLKSWSNDITMRAVIGNKCKQQATFLSVMKEVVEATGGFDLGDLFPSSSLMSLVSGLKHKLERCHQEYDRILDSIIEEHKERRRKKKISAMESEEDLLDILLSLEEEGNLQVPLTIDSIKAVALDIFTAGSDSSSTILVWIMSELIRNPSVAKKAQEEVRGVAKVEGKLTEANIRELAYLKLVIKETLRLHPPLPLLVRECRETREVLGYEIPRKSRVIVNGWAIARDPRYWGDDSEEFKPERFQGTEVDYKGARMDFELLPFGAGRRMCPGMSFGLMNVELALANLLYHFDWELPGGAHANDLDMGETFGATAQKKSDLCLRAISCIT